MPSFDIFVDAVDVAHSYNGQRLLLEVYLPVIAK